MNTKIPLWITGSLSIIFFALHAQASIGMDKGYDVLWACHLACAMVGIGLLVKWRAVLSIGLLWLGVGNLLWLSELTTAGDFRLTSLFTHVGGLICGLLGVHQLGFSRGSWWRASLAFLILHRTTPWLTPSKPNVNLAFRVRDGWETSFPSYGIYIGVLVLTATALFFLFERILLQSLKRKPPKRELS